MCICSLRGQSLLDVMSVFTVCQMVYCNLLCWPSLSEKRKKEKVGINAPVCRWQWFWHGFFKDYLAFDKVRYFLYRRYKYRWNSIIFFNDYSEYLLGYLINCFLKFIQCMFNDVCHSVLYWFCIVTICQKIFVWFLLACLASRSINIYFFMFPCQYCAS